MAAFSPTPDSTTDSVQVSWQTAFWTLASLAINIIAQPCGRVCSFNSRYRTYLRCSPFICVADCISLLIRLGVYGFGFGLGGRIPLRDRLRIVIHYRFIGVDKNDAVKGIRALGKMTWLRWLFFVFGTFTTTIKLMSFEGTPWTKAWGVMFLSSFLIIQVVVVFSWIDRQQGPPVLDSSDTMRVEAVEEELRGVDIVLFKCARLLHLFILLCIVADLWPISSTAPISAVENPDNLNNLLVKTGICAMKIYLITILWAILLWGLGIYIIYCRELEEKGNVIFLVSVLYG